MALLSQPVDADREEAKRLMDRDWTFETPDEMNEQTLVFGTDCIRRGRALERDSREG